MWSHDPLPVSTGFEAFFQFECSRGTPCAADGFAFVVQNTAQDALGGGGGGKGFGGIARSLAVSFPCYPSGGVDANSVSVHTRGIEANSEEVGASLGRAPLGFEIADGCPHMVKVRYDPLIGGLRVWVDDWSREAVAVAVDLGALATAGKEAGSFWVGFTAATGGLCCEMKVKAFCINLGPTHIPARHPLPYRAVNANGLIKKLSELNASAAGQALTSLQLDALSKLARTGGEPQGPVPPEAVEAIEAVLAWPAPARFPGLDLLRLAALRVPERVTESPEATLLSSGYFPAVLERGLGEDVPRSTRLTALRCLANGLCSEMLRKAPWQEVSGRVLEALVPLCGGECDAAIAALLATVLGNAVLSLEANLAPNKPFATLSSGAPTTAGAEESPAGGGMPAAWVACVEGLAAVLSGLQEVPDLNEKDKESLAEGNFRLLTAVGTAVKRCTPKQNHGMEAALVAAGLLQNRMASPGSGLPRPAAPRVLEVAWELRAALGRQ